MSNQSGMYLQCQISLQLGETSTKSKTSVGQTHTGKLDLVFQCLHFGWFLTFRSLYTYLSGTIANCAIKIWMGPVTLTIIYIMLLNQGIIFKPHNTFQTVFTDLIISFYVLVILCSLLDRFL